MSRCYVSVVLVAVVTSIIGAPSGCAPTVPEATLVIQHINRASPHTGTDEIQRSWAKARKTRVRNGHVVVLDGRATKKVPECPTFAKLAEGVESTPGALSQYGGLYSFAILYSTAGVSRRRAFDDLRAFGAALGTAIVELDTVSRHGSKIRRVRGKLAGDRRWPYWGSPTLCNGLRN